MAEQPVRFALQQPLHACSQTEMMHGRYHWAGVLRLEFLSRNHAHTGPAAAGAAVGSGQSAASCLIAADVSEIAQLNVCQVHTTHPYHPAALLQKPARFEAHCEQLADCLWVDLAAAAAAPAGRRRCSVGHCR